MTDSRLLDRLEGRLREWVTVDNLRRHRTELEGVAATLYFVPSVIAVLGWGDVLTLTAVGLMASTLVLYRAVPIVALTVAAVAVIGLMGAWAFPLSGGILLYLPLLAVFFGVSAYGRPVTRWLGLVGVFPASFGVAASGAVSLADGVLALLAFLFVVATLALAWLAGMLVHVNRSRRAAQTGELVATVRLGEAKQEVTLEQERNRVARDVHDIVAHSLAVVIAQADGARYSAKDIPAPVVEALENIAATSRSALTDVRVLLGELRHNQEAGPQPGMDDLDALVRGFRDSGLSIEWYAYGAARELSDAAALAVYRIVQEALTNALRHGDHARPVDVVFDWGSAALTVTVTNALLAGAAVPAKAAGHGIPGMRERATLAGGELEASDGTNGRFRVRATIPFRREEVSA